MKAPHKNSWSNFLPNKNNKFIIEHPHRFSGLKSEPHTCVLLFYTRWHVIYDEQDIHFHIFFSKMQDFFSPKNPTLLSLGFVVNWTYDSEQGLAWATNKQFTPPPRTKHRCLLKIRNDFWKTRLISQPSQTLCIISEADFFLEREQRCNSKPRVVPWSFQTETYSVVIQPIRNTWGGSTIQDPYWTIQPRVRKVLRCVRLFFDSSESAQQSTKAGNSMKKMAEIGVCDLLYLYLASNPWPPVNCS